MIDILAKLCYKLNIMGVNVRVPCHDCGINLDLTIDQLSVIVDRSSRLESQYRFQCSVTGKFMVQLARPEVVDILELYECPIVEYDSTIPHGDIVAGEEISRKLGKITDDEEINFGLVGPEQLAEAVQTELT